MKRKNKPYYLKFYKEWMKSGFLPANGLCWTEGISFLDLLRCSPVPGGGYWGYNGEPIYEDEINDSAAHLGVTVKDIRRKFTPIRQTIVLFLAAMNSEL